MITVIDEKGNVAFINESECVSVVYNKEDRMVRACPIQRTADIGLPMNDMEFFDVVSVTYNNEAQPTSLIFQADKQPAPPTAYDEQPVMVLYEEINRLDELDKREKEKSGEHQNKGKRYVYQYHNNIADCSKGFFHLCNLTFFFIPLFRFYTNASTKNEAIKTATNVIPIMANGKN